MALKRKIFFCALVLVIFFLWFRDKNGKSQPNILTKINPNISSSLNENKPETESEIDVIVIFTKVENNNRLQNSFNITISTLLEYSSGKIRLHIVGDEISQQRASDILNPIISKLKLVSYQMYNIENIAKQILDKLEPAFLSNFRHSVDAYYGDALFFFSLVMHEFEQFKNLKRCIKLDSDLKFMVDIRELWTHFDYFNDHQLFGLVHEQSPVYRHVFSSFRSQIKRTNIGEPLPDGLPGFNSGVILINLEKIRSDDEYKSLLTITGIDILTKKYSFKGHLGDQDFYSLLSTEYLKFFFRLPCQWNRQLCTWWRDHGYADVFSAYNRCDNHVKIYHGNCNSPFPVEDSV